jgi:RNA-directed DNA polymerase
VALARSITGKIRWGGSISRIQFTHPYEDIISVENLLEAWREFVKEKSKRADVQEFGRYLMQNVLKLHSELSAGTYQHGGYHHFKISDPKPRDIHKATVRDRLVHHATCRVLYEFFNRTFIADSYSCRLEKGTHKAMNTFKRYVYRESKNHTKTLWVLKGDIRKFFASIDHQVLLKIIERYISDKRIHVLVANIVGSFNSGTADKGLPLGNLTSQLLVNVYMNEFDQFAKHRLKARYYIRYSDDFVVLSTDRQWLVSLLPRIRDFLLKNLKLELHPNKVSISTLALGVDFLGWVHFPDHRVLRTSTKRRMFRNILENPKPERVHSYLGMLSHGNTFRLRQGVEYLAKLAE